MTGRALGQGNNCPKPGEEKEKEREEEEELAVSLAVSEITKKVMYSCWVGATRQREPQWPDKWARAFADARSGAQRAHRGISQQSP